MTFMFQSEIRSMMYASGDIKSSNEEASQLIENIIRAQIKSLISRAEVLRQERRNKSIGLEDICFIIKKNQFKLQRVLSSVAFKELRKKINEDVADIDGLEVEVKYEWMLENKKRVLLQKNECALNELNGVLYLHDPNAEGNSPTFATDKKMLERLERIDKLTSKMTAQEYLEFSECRQASFTYRKGKKFREFVGIILKDDVMEILGFICYEMVIDIVEEGLKMKMRRKETSSVEKGIFGRDDKNGLDANDVKDGCWAILCRNDYLY